jgi:hypothetical protein
MILGGYFVGGFFGIVDCFSVLTAARFDRLG